MTGSQMIDDKDYHFIADGYALTGSAIINGEQYHFDAKTGELLNP